jgi:hypothetical protein
MPTPSASPPSDITLSDTPRRWSGAKVTRSATGIPTAMIAVLIRLRRKR